MESSEENKDRLDIGSPEQPRPSASKATSPPHLDGTSSPESTIPEKETLLPINNHVTSNTGETGRRIVQGDTCIRLSCCPQSSEIPQAPPPHSDPTWALKATRTPMPEFFEQPSSMVPVVYSVLCYDSSVGHPRGDALALPSSLQNCQCQPLCFMGHTHSISS